jgi:hypothetical protein
MKSSRDLKKRVIVILTVLAVIASFVTPVFAGNLTFTDLSDSKYDWVRPYIEKMNLMGLIKGKSDTSYAPDDSVKRAEVVTMLVRLLGLEEMAEGKQLPASFPKPYSVPEWARGYVALAVEKDIITGNDLKDFRADDAAKRYEVAVFAVKALGYTHEAESKKNVNLSFSDIYDIPLDDSGAWAYIEVAAEKGIMQGFPGGTFKPNDKITRAQMAKMLDNLLKLVHSDDLKSGTVQDVTTIALPSITIKKPDGTFGTYSVSNSTSIYIEDESGNLQKKTLNDIKTGDNVNIILGESNTAVFIERVTNTSVSEGTLLNGIISEIDVSRKLITVKKVDGLDMVLSVKLDAPIKLDGNSASLDDLTVGQPVKLIVTGSDVLSIEAQHIDKQVNGIIRSIISTSNLIVVSNEDTSENETYSVAVGVDIVRDGKPAVFSELKVDDMAQLSIVNSKIIKIVAQSAQTELEGTITDISLAAKNPVITITDYSDDKTSNSCEIDEDVRIRKNDRSASLKDLKIGDYVTINLQHGKAVKITAKSVKRDVSGTIKEIMLSDKSKVTIIDEDNKEHDILITSETDIYKDRKRISVYDLRIGYYLEVEAEGDEAVYVDVTTKEVQNIIRGIVQYKHDDMDVIVISIKRDDGKSDTVIVRYTKDTVIRKGTKDISIRSVDEGDEIVAIGAYDAGLFHADTIIDMTVLN